MCGQRCAIVLVAALAACSGEPSGLPSASSQLAGHAYDLASIDGRLLPAIYYESPDGSYRAAASSGSLVFTDSTVRWDRRVLVYYPIAPTEPYVQDLSESWRYRLVGQTLQLLTGDAVVLTGLLAGDVILITFSHESIPLGQWRFELEQ